MGEEIVQQAAQEKQRYSTELKSMHTQVSQSSTDTMQLLAQREHQLESTKALLQESEQAVIQLRAALERREQEVERSTAQHTALMAEHQHKEREAFQRQQQLDVEHK